MPEEMTNEELRNEYIELSAYMEQHPDDFATAEFLGEVRDEYHHRTGHLPL